ncbi:MAG TPA: LuxR C-terminal-related transcriptional regulator [Polyangiaceae bacterium]|nr:LuxR C-terminal-related transcriptional regulator [Polyangiaceae bacterium]
MIGLENGLFLISITESESATEDIQLSDSERAVAQLALRELSNREIAHQRQASAKTVANQLASAYKKLGISGRRELRARLTEVLR